VLQCAVRRGLRGHCPELLPRHSQAVCIIFVL